MFLSFYQSHPLLTPLLIFCFGVFVSVAFFVFSLWSCRRSLKREQKKSRLEQKRLEEEFAQVHQSNSTRLEQRADELKRISDYKSSFLAHVSHEMRTPLNAIIGFSELIQSSDSIEFTRRQSKVILSETENLLLIINQLLDYAKIEAGKVELTTEPVDFHQLLNAIYKSFQPHAQRKDVELRFVYSDTPQYITADALRVRQILVNLISNAMKFTEDGSITLRIKGESSTSESIMLHFSVSDTGIGIPAEELPTLFQQYTQAHGITSREVGGTGLGTSIAHGLVDMMGGTLCVVSTEGVGSRFSFEITFPIPHVKPEKNTGEINDSPVTLAPPSHVPQGTHILIVDDYPSNLNIARLHLEHAGYLCSCAENGAEAIAITNEEAFDLILMDISMPLIDGYEATRRIRAGETYNADIPIIALSAHADPHTRDECIESGMNDIITKPIRRASFLQQVELWVSEAVHPFVPTDSSSETPSPSSDESLPMDYKRALHEFMDNEEILQDSLAYFVNDVRMSLPRWREACENKEAVFFHQEMHRITGAAKNLCIPDIARVSLRIKDLYTSREPNFSICMQLLDEMNERLDDLTTYLDGLGAH